MAFEPNISVIDHLGEGFIAIMPRPVPGEWVDEEFAEIAAFGIHLVVSLLEPVEAEEIGLGEEAAHCSDHGMDFISFPIPDRGTPGSVEEFSEFAADLCDRIRSGVNSVVHCRAGIGRAGLVAAAVLLHSGSRPEDVFPKISRARGIDVPDTEEQKQWVLTHHDAFRRTGQDFAANP